MTRQLQAVKIRVSLFVDPFEFNQAQQEALALIRPDRIELYTEKYSDFYLSNERSAITARYKIAAETAQRLGIGVNAGHDLNQDNLAYLVQQIPWLDEVSIGHALICEALEQGLQTTIGHYLNILKSTAYDHSHTQRA